MLGRFGIKRVGTVWLTGDFFGIIMYDTNSFQSVLGFPASNLEKKKRHLYNQIDCFTLSDCDRIETLL